MGKDKESLTSLQSTVYVVHALTLSSAFHKDYNMNGAP